MCKKVVTKRAAIEIDPCLIPELEAIKKKYNFKNKFKMIMSCCGHGKYSKTLIVQNTISGCYFDWYSGKILYGTNKRSNSRKPFYKRDKQGYYFIPEIDDER